MKTIDDITLKDLISEDLFMWVDNTKMGDDLFKLQIENSDGERIVEDLVTYDEIEDYASMCRRFLSLYERIGFNKGEENEIF